MPYINKHNLIFIHIPKTGGTSIEAYFDICFPLDGTILRSHEIHVVDGINYFPQHFTSEIIRSHDSEKWDSYKKFTVVRNPYTKVLSEYMSTKKIKQFDNDNFKEWLDWMVTVEKDHHLPQHKYFNKDEVDYILEFENLSYEFISMVKELGVFSKSNLSRRNKHGIDKESLIGKISKENIEIINECFGDDFEYLGYDKIEI